MILIKKPDASYTSDEITPESVYQSRREFMRVGGLLASSIILSGSVFASASGHTHKALLQNKIHSSRQKSDVSAYSTSESVTPFADATRHNNFYEFGLGKGDPAKFAQKLNTDPWSIEVEGEVEKPGKYYLEDILQYHDLEERIYRLRCVEAWSMVIPWLGFPLSDFISRFQPTSEARYVVFETLHDPAQMPGQNDVFSSIDWPYVEGLRIDEAMNPLAFLSVGMYGRALPNQNGAPVRLVVPWKYGFKSIKSIVRVRFQKKQPLTSWQKTAPHEYGFYANVNPDVDHPRWSQKNERRLPNSLFSSNRMPTRRFNGYEEQVSYLYKGMDLRKNF